MRSFLTTVALALLALALPSAAFAADRYAAPGVPVGGGDPAQCPEANPCNIVDAVDVATGTTEDVIHLAAGTHTTAQTLTVRNGVTVKGAGVDITKVEPVDTMVRLLSLGAGASAMDITLDANVPSGGAERAIVGAPGGSTIRRVAAYGGDHACTLTNGVIADSICVGDSYGLSIGSNDDVNATVRNVTAVGRYYGLFASQTAAGNSTFVDAANTIAVGGTDDVRASTLLNADASSTVQVELRNSNYGNISTSTVNSGTALITDPSTAGNQTAEPLFIDAEAKDYRQAEGSPTIDAGSVKTSELGSLDVFGNPRIEGGGIDIGAHEFRGPDDDGDGDGEDGDGDGDNEGEGGDEDDNGGTQPGPAPDGDSDGNVKPGPGPGGAPVGSGTEASGGDAADRIAPRINRLRVNPRGFRVAGGRAKFSKRAGTRIRFSLSKAARVRLTVQRAHPGRLLGRKCVRPSARRVSRKRCLRWIGARGRIVRRGTAGANQLHFSGRLNGRALPAGQYRLIAVAIDAAGNRSAVSRAAFRIARR